MGMTATVCEDCGEWFYSWYGPVEASRQWAEHYRQAHTPTE